VVAVLCAVECVVAVLCAVVEVIESVWLLCCV